MLTAWLDYQSADTLRSAPRLAPGCQDALLRIGACPVAKPCEEIGPVLRRGVELHPVEANRFVLKSPRTDEIERGGK